VEILKHLDQGSVVALVSIDKLKAHEGVKEDYLAELTERIKNDGELFKPILVSKDSLVVLDGHHRFLGCKSLGCKRITAVVVDYFRPNLIVSVWIPLIKEKKEVDILFKVLKKSGFKVETVSSEEKLQSLVNSRDAALGMIVRDSPLKFFVAKSKTTGEDKKTFSEAMKSIINSIRSRQKLGTLQYIADPEEGKQMILDEDAYLMIKVPLIEKEDVIKHSTMEEKYPPKTTRHLLPEAVGEYHVFLERLKQPNPPEDVEQPPEKTEEDEVHTHTHREERFVGNVGSSVY